MLEKGVNLSAGSFAENVGKRDEQLGFALFVLLQSHKEPKNVV